MGFKATNCTHITKFYRGSKHVILTSKGDE